MLSPARMKLMTLLVIRLLPLLLPDSIGQ